MGVRHVHVYPKTPVSSTPGIKRQPGSPPLPRATDASLTPPPPKESPMTPQHSVKSPVDPGQITVTAWDTTCEHFPALTTTARHDLPIPARALKLEYTIETVVYEPTSDRHAASTLTRPSLVQIIRTTVVAVQGTVAVRIRVRNAPAGEGPGQASPNAVRSFAWTLSRDRVTRDSLPDCTRAMAAS